MSKQPRLHGSSIDRDWRPREMDQTYCRNYYGHGWMDPDTLVQSVAKAVLADLLSLGAAALSCDDP